MRSHHDNVVGVSTSSLRDYVGGVDVVELGVDGDVEGDRVVLHLA